ncbi:MAG: carbohydrate ABC transporter permease [Clostridiaceae bacterium]|nr:carbohydrate ABC transporter permease [Clostridiaceae bacterium]
MKTNLSYLTRVLKLIFLTLTLIIIIFPILYIILASFKSNEEILVSGASLFPKKFLLSNYTEAWRLANFKMFTFNSIYMTFFIVIGNIITSTILAYVFSRGKFVGKKLIFALMISTMFVALGSSALYPQLQMAKMIGIPRSLLGVIIIRVFGISVTNIFIGMGYLESIPIEIDEAAKIDGCGFIRIYWSIIFPLLKPLIATIGLLTFRAAWNDYMLPMVFTLTKPLQQPLIVGVVNLRNTGEAASSYNLMIAGAAIAIIPMLIVYLFLNRYFISGLTTGAVKG